MPKGKMTDEQRERWKPFSEIMEGDITEEHYKAICELHADLYQHRYEEPCGCSPKRLKNWAAQINKIYNAEKHT